MNTPYVRLSLKTQQQLKMFLSLFSKIGIKNQQSIVGVRFTEAEGVYPEKILNLKWSLSGSFKVVQFIANFGEENGLNECIKLSTLLDHKETQKTALKQRVAWLYNNLSTIKEATVSGKDFKEGVGNLFTLLSTPETTSQVMYPLVIRRQGGEGYFSYTLLKFNNIKRSFETLAHL